METWRLGLLVEVLQPFLQTRKKSAGVGAVDQTVVVAQRENAHRPDRHHVVDDDHTLFDGADAKDGHLGLIDDRHAELGAVLAVIGNRERAAAYFLRLLRKVTHGPAAAPIPPAIAGAEWLAWAPLVVLILAVGLVPALALGATDVPVQLLTGAPR